MQIRTAVLTLALAVVAAPPLQAQTPPTSSWDAFAASIESAAAAGRSDQLRAARLEALKQLASAPADREPLLRYGLAYIGWRMAVLPDVSKQESAGLLDDAVNHLKAAVKKNGAFAEAHGLLGSVYGLQIGTSTWKGITLGPRASGAIDTAVSLEPDNPRILLAQGVSAFHTPSMFGGGIDKAEQLLRRSLERFAHEPRDKPWPNWGRTDAHAWLGQVLQKRGDAAGARSQYEAALALNPEYGWVRYVLLPAVMKDQKR